ncbi:hypothetical protein MesoLjLc_45710 [Mesorhizobium sp. L-8-10]|uniref:phage tail length tape measure family protein n=1 Tax=Mesorhizobium sp. L-8-10 TaxID=2744523 RepID=UPI0019287B1F|nr:phage tail length tape measure family protein [Mesorhizobium sp. L-8-10]BCH32641.1 hypothetical protein MesoLjLc_45710 [Mesorhizobium sp. L-8-10]
MASTAEDQARLLVSIEATQAKYLKQMETIARASARSAKSSEDAFKKANDNIGRSSDQGGRKAAQSLGQARAAAQNLSFQLNDIAMQLASGTSPFTVMIQQGGQVAQIMQGSGGIKGAITALGGAITGLLNPVGLLSVGLIGATGFAVQYFAELVSSGKVSNEELEKQVELIQRVADKWGDTMPALKAYADELKNAADAADRLAAGEAALSRIYEKPREQARAFALPGIADLQLQMQGFGQDAQAIDGLRSKFDELNEKIDQNKATVADVREFQKRLFDLFRDTGLPAAKDLGDQFGTLAEEMAKVEPRGAAIREEVDRITLSASEAKAMAAALVAQMVGLGPQGANAVGQVATELTSTLIPALGDAGDKVRDLVENYRKMQKMIERSPLGTLSPLVSGGGQFLNPDQFNTFRANEANLRAAGESAASAMIKSFEGFIANAKWDVNAFRAGFGSDTVTRASGLIEKVTKDTVVTLDDAERDLSRRILEFQSGIQDAIGIDTWRSLSEGQQAALTSIAYNYGSLPKRIVEAIQQGGGPEAVAKAINALGADNNGINANRRREEAQSFLSGTGISMSEAGLGGRKSRTPADTFKGSLEDVQRRIDLLNAEYEAQARVNPLVNDYGYAVEKARIQQDLLNKAQEAGVAVTPELAAKIESLATNMAKASAGAEQLQDRQQRLADQAAEIRDIGHEAIGGLISDLVNGKDAAEALSDALARVGDRLLNMALDGLFSGFGKGGGGGLLGGFIIPGILHRGGVAGRDGYGHGRAVSPSVFSGARRYHSGGVAGLQPGEVPAILQRGEVVLPRGSRAGGTETIRINLRDDSGRMAEIADQRIETASGTIVQVSVQQSTKAVQKQFPGMLAQTQTRFA